MDPEILAFDFSIGDREAILTEAVEAAQELEREQAAGRRLVKSVRQRGGGLQVSEVLAGMKQEKAGFGPYPELIAFNAPQLEARGISLDDRLKALLERFDFYLLTFAVTLFPRPGWAFDRLECQVEFNPGERAQDRPLAHDVFPASSWETLAQANLKLEVGVTESLEFRVKKSIDLMPAGADVQGKLAAGASFVFPPREYTFRRPRIVSRGKDDSEVLWRLDEDRFLEGDGPHLGVVLKVPRTAHRLHVTGALAASRSFQLLTADMRDVVNYMSAKLQHFFKSGAPLVDRADWDLTAEL